VVACRTSVNCQASQPAPIEDILCVCKPEYLSQTEHINGPGKTLGVAWQLRLGMARVFLTMHLVTVMKSVETQFQWLSDSALICAD
jgi:hypothetical protein